MKRRVIGAVLVLGWLAYALPSLIRTPVQAQTPTGQVISGVQSNSTPHTITVDNNGNVNTTIGALPAIVYHATGITPLTDGQTSTDVQITKDGWVLFSGGATSDGVAVLSTATTSTLGSTVWAVDANPGNLYGFNIGQASSAVCYLQTFNAAPGSVTLGTTASVATFVIPGLTTGAGNSIPPGSIPIKNFSIAISAALTTTATGSTTCGPGVGTVFFK